MAKVSVTGGGGSRREPARLTVRMTGAVCRNGVPFQAAAGRLVVAAADACGSAVLFEA
jgi:hypothetical protein